MKMEIYLVSLLVWILSACNAVDTGDKKLDQHILDLMKYSALCAPMMPNPMTVLLQELSQESKLDRAKKRVNVFESANLNNASKKMKDFIEGTLNDTKEYENIIIGDSTMQGNTTQLPGVFYDPKRTQPVAVAGNRLCDILGQLDIIRSNHPKAIIAGTMGGNDLGMGADVSYIIEHGIALYAELRRRFPDAYLVFVAVHPTKNVYANANKGQTNSALRDFITKDPHTCWYDPMEIFGVGEGESAPDELMLDAVHYHPGTVGMSIKLNLYSHCIDYQTRSGVTF